MPAGSCEIQIRRDGSVLDSSIVVAANVGVTFLVVDVPGAGTFTYDVYVDNTGMAYDAAIGNRTLVALVAKK